MLKKCRSCLFLKLSIRHNSYIHLANWKIWVPKIICYSRTIHRIHVPHVQKRVPKFINFLGAKLQKIKWIYFGDTYSLNQGLVLTWKILVSLFGQLKNIISVRRTYVQDYLSVTRVILVGLAIIWSTRRVRWAAFPFQYSISSWGPWSSVSSRSCSPSRIRSPMAFIHLLTYISSLQSKDEAWILQFRLFSICRLSL